MRRIVIAIICLSAATSALAYEIVGADISSLKRMANDPNYFDGSVGLSVKDIKGFRAEARAELKRQAETVASQKSAYKQAVTPQEAAPVPVKPQEKPPSQGNAQ